MKLLIPPGVRRAIGKSREIADEQQAEERFVASNHRPWTTDYDIHKIRVIRSSLADEGLLRAFRQGGELPEGFGYAVDERCVEYPWVIAHLLVGTGRVLDAGSALNFGFVLEHPVFDDVDVHLLTFAPEDNCFWDRGFSYLFADLRDLPIRDGFYDTVVCLSTLEHVGLDNSAYTGDDRHAENRPSDFKLAVSEMSRVLRPGGRFLLTVPFGRRSTFDAIQIFDMPLLEQAIAAFGPTGKRLEAFYRYSDSGWQVATPGACRDAEYVIYNMLPPAGRPSLPPIEPDRAAAARAVACVQLIKA